MISPSLSLSPIYSPFACTLMHVYPYILGKMLTPRYNKNWIFLWRGIFYFVLVHLLVVFCFSSLSPDVDKIEWSRLKHGIFDLNQKNKVTLRNSLNVGLFISTFFWGFPIFWAFSSTDGCNCPGYARRKAEAQSSVWVSKMAGAQALETSTAFTGASAISWTRSWAARTQAECWEARQLSPLFRCCFKKQPSQMIVQDVFVC